MIHVVHALAVSIRRFSLDELPQIINVVRGEMSWMGPRPNLPEEVEQYQEWHKKRLTVSPGITGMWQVSGRSDLTFDEMVLLDIYYVENWNLAMDYGYSIALDSSHCACAWGLLNILLVIVPSFAALSDNLAPTWGFPVSNLMKRILILMSKTGGGHLASAQAIQATFAAQYGTKVEATIVDLLMDYLPWPMREAPKSYGWIANRTPWLWSTLYRAGHTSWIADPIIEATVRLSATSIMEMFVHYRPDLIVSVHPLVQELALHALERLAGQNSLCHCRDRFGDSSSSLVSSRMRHAVMLPVKLPIKPGREAGMAEGSAAHVWAACASYLFATNPYHAQNYVLNWAWMPICPRFYWWGVAMALAAWR